MGKTAILSVRIISDAKDAIKGLGDAEGAAGGFGSKLAGIGPGALAVGGAVITGVVAAGKALFDLGTTFDHVEDTIRGGTGATGEALEGLIDDAHAVATSIPTDFEAAGQTVADLNTRLGLSGNTLQTVASQYLEAARILGEDVDIKATTGAFSAFKVEGEAVSGAMDDLFRVSQATGVSMNDLAGSAQKNAAALQEMGFGFTDSIALIGGLDKAGVDADSTLNAMRKGLVSIAKPGQDMGSALFEVTDKINAFIGAGDTAAAIDLASQVFGTKGAAQMVQALQTGLINAEDLTGALGVTGDTILGVGKETMSAGEKWQILKNRGMEALEPLASGVFDLVSKGLDLVTGWLDGFDTSPLDAAGPAIAAMSSGFSSVAEKIGPLVTGIRDTLGPVFETLAPIASAQIQVITGAISGIIDIITGVVTIIRGIVTGDWSLIWDGVQQVVTSAIGIVKTYVFGIGDWISNAFSLVSSIARNLWGQVWDYVKSAVINGAASIGRTVSEIPGKVLSALGNAGTLLFSSGKDLIRGFINGIGSMGSALWDAAKNIASNAVDSIKSFLGIHSPSRVFRQIGMYSAQGLIIGLEDNTAKVEKAWNSLVSLPTAPRLGFDAAKNTTAPVSINITVNGAIDPVGTAEQIRRILDAHDLRTGHATIGGPR